MTDVKAIITQLKFDAYYLQVSHMIGLVYISPEHEAHIKQWVKDNYNKLSDQYKPLVDQNK